MRPQAIYGQERIQREAAAAFSWWEGIRGRKNRKAMRMFFITRGPRATHRHFPWMHDASRILFVEQLKQVKQLWWVRLWQFLRSPI